MLIEQVSILVEVLPRSQTNLMKAMKIGLLRDVAKVSGEEQTYSTPTFISKQVRAVRTSEDIKEKKTLAHLEITSDAQVASVTIPEAAMFAEMSDVIVQAVLYEDQLTDFAGYKPLVMDIEMYQGEDEKFTAIKVADLEEEIHVKLPVVAEQTLACAFFNEDVGDWESLKCENEVAAEEGFITCCTDHLTRFALVPAEYLEIVQKVQELEKSPVETE